MAPRSADRRVTGGSRPIVRVPVEVALVEGGKVVHDAQEVVGELKDHVLDEALAELLRTRASIRQSFGL